MKLLLFMVSDDDDDDSMQLLIKTISYVESAKRIFNNAVKKESSDGPDDH